MSGGFFAYPQAAAFGRQVPKSRIFAFGKPGRRVRNCFANEVAKITWTHKLAPETINLPAAPGVAEIQVFAIELKPGVSDLTEDLLRCMDQAIAFPILFEVARHGTPGGLRVVAAYKRPSEAETGKWVVGEYFATDWLPADAPRAPLPVALSLGVLYEQLLRGLMPVPARPNETLAAQADRAGRAAVLRRQCRMIESRLNREKQFNRKVQINSELRAAQNELAACLDSPPSQGGASPMK